MLKQNVRSEPAGRKKSPLTLPSHGPTTALPSASAASTWTTDNVDDRANSGRGILRLVLLNCFLLQGIFVLRQSEHNMFSFPSSSSAVQQQRRGTWTRDLSFLINSTSYSTGVMTPVMESLSASDLSYESVETMLDSPSLRPKQQQQQHRHQSDMFPTIQELVATSNVTSSDCSRRRGGLVFMDNVDLPIDDVWGGQTGTTTTKGTTTKKNRIPKIVHVTSKSRCLTQSFYDNVNKWKFEDHALYFHDDAAVDRLLQEPWPEFPELQKMQHCMISGAAKADLWRYLVLYKYGGIFTDIDNMPTKDFFMKDKYGNPTNQTIIKDEYDSFFVVEQIGVLSQYFMASSPRHPLMYLCVLQVFRRLMDVEAVGTQYVPYVTGPGALKNAFIEFMGRNEGGKVHEGTYIGHQNRSVTVVGSRRQANKYVHRESIHGAEKRRSYRVMGMNHFSRSSDTSSHLNISCYLKLYDEHHQTVSASN